ncbi:MAG: M20/M25/M40 family metallo-hydrolase [Thermoleophilia bacterium]
MAADRVFLKDLLLAPGPTGFEAPAQEVAKRHVAAIAALGADPLGNVWADVNESGHPHVVVTGHIDQIGLIVTHVDEHGFVSFDRIGGLDAPLLPGRNFIIHDDRGPVEGVVGRKPTHLMKPEEREKALPINEQWLDIGAADRAAALNLVAVGDPITFMPHVVEFAGGTIASPGCDNRAGVYVAYRALEQYAQAPGAARLTALSTTHEETTFMGARAMTHRWRPDVIIVVDVSFASDHPGSEPGKIGGEAKLGAGPLLQRGAASNHALLKMAREVAAQEEIPVQIVAQPGRTSTDAEEFMAAGECALLSLSIPLRYMHSPFEVIDPEDAEAGARLVAALTRRLGEGFEREAFVPRA